MSSKNNTESDYEPINITLDKENKKKINDDTPPDDLNAVIVKMFKKVNMTTGLFIFILYMLISTDCFQLYIARELYKGSYDAKTDSITDSGIVFNGIFLTVFYLLFDVCCKK